MEEQKMEKKVSTAETILIMMVLILIDAVEILLDLVGVGLVTGPLINIPVTMATQFYLYMKGIKGTASLIGGAFEFIPVVNALPIRSATMAATIYIANNPKLAAAAGIASGKVNRPGTGTGHENWTPAPSQKSGQGPHLQTPIQLQPAPITIKPVAQ